MEKKENFGYVQFPLCLIMETHKNREHGIDLMLDYGIMHFAQKRSCTDYEAARQIIYDYLRNTDVLQSRLVRTINNNEDDLILEDEFIFRGLEGFNPDDEAINAMIKLMDSDSEFKEGAKLNAKFHEVCKNDHLGITISSNDAVLRRYKEAVSLQEKFESQFGPDAMPCCKKGLLFEFRDKPQNEISLFQAYIAISSMLGQRNFISTNKPAILSRMIGCKSKKAFEHYKDDKALKPTIERYSKRYQMDQLLLQLAERKFIMFLSRKDMRFIYVSKYMQPEELAELIKKSKSEKDLRTRIKNATAAL